MARGYDVWTRGRGGTYSLPEEEGVAWEAVEK